MAAVFDTAEVTPGKRFEYWCDESQRRFMPVRVARQDSGPFQAQLWMDDLCGIKISRAGSNPTLIRRTAQDIAEHDPESLMLVVSVHGQTTGTQDERASSCGPGDITLWDSSRPYTTRSLSPTTILTFSVPKSMLRRDAARLAKRTALRIHPASDRSRLVRPYLCELAKSLQYGSVRSDEVGLAEGLLSLVPSLYEPDPSALPGPALLLQVKAYIDEYLGDPDLDPERIADAHFVSRRHLYRLFEAEHVGVREWIRERRLHRCAEDLADPTHAHQQVFTIAARWGFTSPNHFSRCFRAAYGLPPRDFRRAAIS